MAGHFLNGVNLYSEDFCINSVTLPPTFVDPGKYGAVLEGPTAEYLEERNCDLRIMPERISSLEKLTGESQLVRKARPRDDKAHVP